MPPRSSGCFTCRKRKIRCDEGRPGCERCAKHGVPCPGYRRERDGIEFEDQTLLTVQRVKDQHGGSNPLVVRKASKSSKLSSAAEGQSPLIWQAQEQSLLAWPAPKSGQPWSTVSSPKVQQFFSPALEQTKIWDTFLDIYMPKASGLQSLHFSYLLAISQLAPSQPALRDGLNTLALIQIGELHKDERLVNAAVESYGKALNGMRKVIAKSSSVRDDLVLAAASILMVCEFYDKVKTEGSGWFGHVFGVEQLLLARGPDSFDTQLSLQLFYNSRHASLARSYILRTADPYATPAWRAVAGRAPMQDWSMELFDIVMQVPGQLQNLDQLDPNGALAVEELDILLAESAVLESALRSWFERYHENLSGHGIKAYSLVSINDFTTFASLVTDRTMPTAYRFASFWSAYVHSQYWIAMHYLRANIKVARELRQNLGVTPPSDLAGAVTDDELMGYAYDLCRTMPSFTEPEAGSQGHIGLFVPLAVVMMHFRNKENWKWCLWGLNVKNNIFSKGLRQPDIKEEDLPKPKQVCHSPMTPGQSSFMPIASSSTSQSPSSSDQSSQAFDDMSFLVDDMHDVDLSIDWGQKTPGMAAVAMGGISQGFIDEPTEAELVVKDAWEHWHDKTWNAEHRHN